MSVLSLMKSKISRQSCPYSYPLYLRRISPKPKARKDIFANGLGINSLPTTYINRIYFPQAAIMAWFSSLNSPATFTGK